MNSYAAINIRCLDINQTKQDLINAVVAFINHRLQDDENLAQKYVSQFVSACQEGALLKVIRQFDFNTGNYFETKNTHLIVPIEVHSFLTQECPHYRNDENGAREFAESFNFSVSNVTFPEFLEFKPKIMIKTEEKEVEIEQNEKEIILYLGSKIKERKPFIPQISDYFWKKLMPAFRRFYNLHEKDINTSGSSSDSIRIKFSDKVTREMRKCIMFTVFKYTIIFNDDETPISLFTKIQWGRMKAQKFRR